jgi:hypothetical protein
MKRVLYLQLYRSDDSPYKYMAIGCRDDCGGFTGSVTYYSERYGKSVTVSSPYRSDGATSAPDIDSDAWWFHDVLCDRGTWDDGTPLTNWQCSTVLYDTMRDDGFSWSRSTVWRHITFACGGGKARENGMFSKN